MNAIIDIMNAMGASDDIEDDKTLQNEKILKIVHYKV
jgi:hypothetical protein